MTENNENSMTFMKVHEREEKCTYIFELLGRCIVKNSVQNAMSSVDIF